MPTRRTTVIALGGLLAGGGALLGTGAFGTVEAERSVSLETADDSDAFLAFEILDANHVDETDGTIDFDLLADAATTFADLVNVRNNGTQVVTSLRFEFDVTGADQSDDAVEDALRIVSGGAAIDAVDQANLLVESDAGDAGDGELSPGEAVPFGIAVDLTGNEVSEITGDPEIALTIVADTGGEGGSGNGDGGDGSGFDYDLQSVSLADGNGNDIDVTVSVDTNDPNATLLIESLRPESSGNPNDVRDDATVALSTGTSPYSASVLGSNGDQVDRVRVTLRDGDGETRDVITRGWPP